MQKLYIKRQRRCSKKSRRNNRQLLSLICSNLKKSRSPLIRGYRRLASNSSFRIIFSNLQTPLQVRPAPLFFIAQALSQQPAPLPLISEILLLSTELRARCVQAKSPPLKMKKKKRITQNQPLYLLHNCPLIIELPTIHLRITSRPLLEEHSLLLEPLKRKSKLLLGLVKELVSTICSTGISARPRLQLPLTHQIP